CGRFEDFVETGMAPHDQVAGQGCVFPAHVLNIANQFEQKGLRWKGYMEDMGNDPAREPATCGHPRIGDPDRTQGAQKESAGHPLDQYATKHDPFMYFHSIIDAPSCDSNVVSFATLESDLASATPMANYVFITPNLCSDGHDSHCVSGRPAAFPRSTSSFARGCLAFLRRRHSRTACSSSPSTRHRRSTRARVATSSPAPIRRAPASLVRAAAGSAPYCCRHSSRRVRCPTCRTTTTPCCAAWKIFSASRRIWASRRRRDCGPSGRTSTRHWGQTRINGAMGSDVGRLTGTLASSHFAIRRHSLPSSSPLCCDD